MYLNIDRIKKVLRQFKDDFMFDYSLTRDCDIEGVLNLFSELNDVFEKEVEPESTEDVNSLQFYVDTFTKKDLKNPFIGEVFTKEHVERIFEEEFDRIPLILDKTFKKQFSRHMNIVLIELAPK